MSASKLIQYFSGHPTTFGFWASLPPDNITLNTANKRIEYRVFQTKSDTGAAAHVILDTKQLISCTRTVASLWDSDGGVITTSQLHELCTKIHDILDNALSKWVVILLIF